MPEGIVSERKAVRADRSTLAALLVAWIVLSIPVFCISVLPSVDFPNHLARAFLLGRWGDLHGYASFYSPHWTVLPNLALDLLATPLERFLPPFIGGQIFVALSIGLTIFGGARLIRAVSGQWSLWGLAPALLVYNRIFAYGFFNFLFGLGLLMWALAVHIERRDARPLQRLWPGLLFAFGLFTCHLVTLALYALLAAAFDVGFDFPTKVPSKRWRQDFLNLSAQLAIPAALLLLGSPTSQEAGTVMFRDPWLRFKLLDSVFQTGQGDWDALFAALVLFTLAALWAARKIEFEKRMLWPLSATAIVFLVAPYGFKDAENVDTRLPLVVALVLFAGLAPTSKRAGFQAGLAVALLLGIRSLTTALHYAAWQEDVDQVQADLRSIPPGSLVFQTRDLTSRAFDADGWDPPMIGMDCLLLFNRPAFVSNFFALPDQQPMIRTAFYRDLKLPQVVGGAAMPTLASYSFDVEDSTARLTSAPVFIWYLKPPGPLDVPSGLRAVVVRKRYAILEVLPTERHYKGSAAVALDGRASKAPRRTLASLHFPQEVR